MRKAAQPRATTYYRRSPHLVCYWGKDRVIFENYLARKRVRAAPLTFDILQLFDTWRTADVLADRFPGMRAGLRRRVVRALQSHSLLERCSGRPRSETNILQGWKHWSPTAALLHFSAKDGRGEPDLERISARLRKRAKHEPMPSAVKRYRGSCQIQLAAPERRGSFPEVLLSRRTWRKFSGEAVDLQALSTLLGLTFGVQGWVELPSLGRVALKTSPSAGGRHPLEAYVLALKIRGLEQGLYHYAADSHQLEGLRAGCSKQEAVRFLAGQKWFGEAAALVFMTAVFPRVQWKYRSPRAYLTVLADAGHMCQTFCLVATWLGLAPFCTMALASTDIEKALHIDGMRESILYAAGVGAKPRGIEWAPWPDHPYGRRVPNPTFVKS